MSRQVGDYKWRQLSMWAIAPKKCIEKFVTADQFNRKDITGTVFHYYLLRITKIVSDNQWKVEVVTDINNVPEDVLMWRGANYNARDIK